MFIFYIRQRAMNYRGLAARRKILREFIEMGHHSLKNVEKICDHNDTVCMWLTGLNVVDKVLQFNIGALPVECIIKRASLEIIDNCMKNKLQTLSLSVASMFAGMFARMDVLLLCNFKRENTDNFFRAICNATRRGHIDIVRQLISEFVGKVNWIPVAIMSAIDEGDIPIIRMCRSQIVSGRIGVEEGTFGGMISCATEGGKVEVVKLFLAWGYEYDFNSSLIHAAMNGFTELVRLFFEHSIVDMCTENIERAISLAAAHGRTETVALLKSFL